MISATASSDKLPIGYEVKLMKICEKCTTAELRIDRLEKCEKGKPPIVMGTIRCIRLGGCKMIVEMYERIRDDGEGIPEQNTDI